MHKNLIDDTQALLDGHIDANGTTRRFALKAALGVGYASAVYMKYTVTKCVVYP